MVLGSVVMRSAWALGLGLGFSRVFFDLTGSSAKEEQRRGKDLTSCFPALVWIGISPYR